MDWFSFEGRISRSTYWLQYVLPMFVLGLVVIMVAGKIGLPAARFILVLSMWPAMAGAVKRCHDRGHSGWYVLIGLIPVIGGLWLSIELGLLAGTPGANEYGMAVA